LLLARFLAYNSPKPAVELECSTMGPDPLAAKGDLLLRGGEGTGGERTGREGKGGERKGKEREGK